MKNTTKILLGGTLLTLGAVTLSSCTQSFCSTKDKAHMMYAFDYGVTEYYNVDAEIPESETVTINNKQFKVTYSFDNCVSLKKIIDTAKKNNIATPSVNFFERIDEKVMQRASDVSNIHDFSTIEDFNIKDDFLKEYGYVKFYYSTDVKYTHTKVRWENWDNIVKEVRSDTTLDVDELPNDDFVAFYKKQMETLIANYRSCLTTKDGLYGFYGAAGERDTINIEKKDYGYGWSRGFFEGLLIWPIGALTDVIVSWFPYNMVANGTASIIAILLITIIVRSFMLIFTAKQTANTAKMNELQPEIAKIQAKYPNANTNQNEKMRLAEETQKLYKKYDIHPFRSILVMFIQFPIFICVWGALQGSAALSTGTFLGLNLSSSISSVLFNGENWKVIDGHIPGLTALFLFLLMAISQAAAMLLPQIIQKIKAKKIAKLGRNPAKKQNDRRMQIFTYAMLIMIIVMGFSLASGMGVYWFIGAIFSLVQTLITQLINDKKSKKERRR